MSDFIIKGTHFVNEPETPRVITLEEAGLSIPQNNDSEILLPNDEQLRRYSATADTYNQVALDFRHKNMEVAGLIEQEILQMLKFAPQVGKVLDAGCGTGVYSTFMGLMGYRVVGVDFSEGQVNLAQSEIQSENIEFHQENILDYPVNTGEYDAILINSMFHHILKQDRKSFLLKMRRGLTDSGRILLITRTHPESREDFIEATKLGKKTARIASRSTEAELLQLINESGFSIDADFSKEPHPDDPEGIFHHLLLREKFDVEA